jgi:hypothetical protein
MIKNIGFSFHGGRGSFMELLEVYNWDFCMVQYNYFDENDQAGGAGVRAAYDRGIPVFVMEPLRGGLLARNLPDGAKKAFAGVDPERSPAQWAFLWLYDQPQVSMALSGMTDVSQLAENAAFASEASPGMLVEAERHVYKDAVASLRKAVRVPCTSCGYCLPCPKGVDIPACFSCYNAGYSFGRFSGFTQYVQVTGQLTPARSDASNCLECGACSPRCPQGIDIPQELKKVRRRMLSFVFVPLMGFLRKLWRLK